MTVDVGTWHTKLSNKDVVNNVPDANCGVNLYSTAAGQIPESASKNPILE